MRLAQYLAANNITKGAFAKRLGVARQVLARYLDEKSPRTPHPDIRQRIYTATGGAVTLLDLIHEGRDYVPEPKTKAPRKGVMPEPQGEPPAVPVPADLSGSSPT